MIRLDPLTQSVTAPIQAGAQRPAQAPAQSVAPAETVARFVAAADSAAETESYESGYAAVRLRRRMSGQISGLTKLDSRLSGAAAGLQAPAPDPRVSDQIEVEARKEAEMAELRGAVASLSVAINWARADVAGVLRQMQEELAAAMAALSAGGNAPAASLVEGTATSTSGQGETLVRQAAELSARAGLA